MTAHSLNTPTLFEAQTLPEHSACSPDVARLSPTEVFHAFWTFAAERQAIFWRRLNQQEPPWTYDPILATFKFTNAYRASDRVSQYLIRNVIYNGDQSLNEVVFRTLLFKLFNKIETWELLKNALGSIDARTFKVDRYDRVLNQAFASGQRIYSPAYIMPSGSQSFRSPRKHTAHLELLRYMLQDRLTEKIQECRSLRALFELLRSYPLLGDFLAYQYAIDLNYSSLLRFEESEFVMPGPGARSGIAKCFSDRSRYSEADIIRIVTDVQAIEFQSRGIQFQGLGSRQLQLIDVQNLFCEIDKYARVRFPQSAGATSRTRIKQRFSPKTQSIVFWYPPKWNVHLPARAS